MTSVWGSAQKNSYIQGRPLALLGGNSSPPRLQFPPPQGSAFPPPPRICLIRKSIQFIPSKPSRIWKSGIETQHSTTLQDSTAGRQPAPSGRLHMRLRLDRWAAALQWSETPGPHRTLGPSSRHGPCEDRSTGRWRLWVWAVQGRAGLVGRGRAWPPRPCRLWRGRGRRGDLYLPIVLSRRRGWRLFLLVGRLLLAGAGVVHVSDLRVVALARPSQGRDVFRCRPLLLDTVVRTVLREHAPPHLGGFYVWNVFKSLTVFWMLSLKY